MLEEPLAGLVGKTSRDDSSVIVLLQSTIGEVGLGELSMRYNNRIDSGKA